MDGERQYGNDCCINCGQYSRFIALKHFCIRTPTGSMEYPIYTDICDFCGFQSSADSRIITQEIIQTISEFNATLWKK